jgi:molybdopterin converting factor small subunit
MATLYVLSSRGDRRVTWAPKEVEAGDPEALAAVAEAEAIFARERSRGSSAFKVVDGEPAQRIDTFDRTADEIVIIPRMAGG